MVTRRNAARLRPADPPIRPDGSLFFRMIVFSAGPRLAIRAPADNSLTLGPQRRGFTCYLKAGETGLTQHGTQSVVRTITMMSSR